jgi:hypothetical protein
MKHFKLYKGFKVKLAPRYIGPFKVRGCVGPCILAYRLELPQQLRMHNVCHVSALKPYHSDGQYQPPALPQYLDGEIEYEVDWVASTCFEGMCRFYLVHWVGYPSGQTWEPKPRLTNCAEKVQDFGSGEQIKFILHRGHHSRASLPKGRPRKRPRLVRSGRA